LSKDLGEPDAIDARLDRLSRQPFRARFHLRGRDRAVAELRGPHTVRRHAEDLIEQRLAPAQPANDGRQTPYRGHPVFAAQHASATCCRACLSKWHDIATGTALTAEQQTYVVDVIMRWIGREMASQPVGSSHRDQ